VLMLNMTSPTFDTPMYPWVRISNRIDVLKDYVTRGSDPRHQFLVAAIGEIESVRSTTVPAN
jgi:hypothetical protein